MDAHDTAIAQGYALGLALICNLEEITLTAQRKGELRARLVDIAAGERTLRAIDAEEAWKDLSGGPKPEWMRDTAASVLRVFREVLGPEESPQDPL